MTQRCSLHCNLRIMVHCILYLCSAIGLAGTEVREEKQITNRLNQLQHCAWKLQKCDSSHSQEDSVDFCSLYILAVQKWHQWCCHCGQTFIPCLLLCILHKVLWSLKLISEPSLMKWIYYGPENSFQSGKC